MLKDELQRSGNMLVLGAGLGSAAYILDKMRLPVPLTFVDIDPTSIAWAKELMPGRILERTQWHCSDVRDFITTHRQQYDILVIDIFIDRVVPTFVMTGHFLRSAAALLKTSSGRLVLNYIINQPAQWQLDRQLIATYFHIVHIIDLGLNQVVIAHTLPE